MSNLYLLPKKSVNTDLCLGELARQVLRSAKRKYGSAYWYHSLLGKFQLSGGGAK
ncbi:hypothetical protein NBK70_002595 [Escherichia coli]|nr:hypothetical protein [Escherichia coli]EKG3308625.1 hypothetical protein [Escherichia coli]